MDKIKKFLDDLKGKIGEQLFALLLAQLLTKENIIKFIDLLLDQLEELAKKTDTKIDDEALKKIREALNIEDND